MGRSLRVTNRVHQPYAPYRYSASCPSHPHCHPWQDQDQRRHKAIDDLQQQHIAVDYTSCAAEAAAGQVGVAVGGGGYGAGAGEGRH
jgi:hypothetical protein